MLALALSAGGYSFPVLFGCIVLSGLPGTRIPFARRVILFYGIMPQLIAIDMPDKSLDFERGHDKCLREAQLACFWCILCCIDAGVNREHSLPFIFCGCQQSCLVQNDTKLVFPIVYNKSLTGSKAYGVVVSESINLIFQF